METNLNKNLLPGEPVMEIWVSVMGPDQFLLSPPSSNKNTSLNQHATLPFILS